MQLETSYLEYDGAKMMVGYALIKNQRMIMILTEGQLDSQLTSVMKDENSGISRLSLDTFKTALLQSNTPEENNLEQTSICLIGATHPNKLFFMRIDHSQNVEVSKAQELPRQDVHSDDFSVVNEEQRNVIYNNCT
jgi:hypothetical protein